MKTQAASTLITSLFALSSMTSTGAVLISTGFAGTTLGGGDAADMTDVTYTVSDGLTGPETIGSSSHSIFNTGDSTGHYAPNVQVNNGSWSLSFDMAVGGTGLNIDSVTLDRRHFNVAGAFNTASDKTYPITVQLVGSMIPSPSTHPHGLRQAPRQSPRPSASVGQPLERAKR